MVATFEPRPAFASYVARKTVRPVAIRASDIDDALMPPPGVSRG